MNKALRIKRRLKLLYDLSIF